LALRSREGWELTVAQIWDAIKDGTIYQIPSLLSTFTIISYADLKKYKFFYWFAFPTIHSNPTWKRTGSIERLGSKECEALVDKIGTWKYGVDNREHGFFLAKRVRTPPPNFADSPSDDEAEAASRLDRPDEDPAKTSFEELGFRWVVGSLRKFEDGFFDDAEEKDRYVSFVDPSTYAENPGWPSRNLLVLIRQRFRLRKVQLLCYRDSQARRHEARSIIMNLEMDPVEEMELAEMPKVTGWERHPNTKLQARVANLAEYMDPARLADSAVDLNLKLMKWRISPNLNLDAIKDTKCLLLGAGTLGGYVSRNLMGWGVRKITFVDYGKVSYSNPVRQPLFDFNDCLNGGAPKAATAAKALKDIYPGVESEGHEMEVPMLGHAFTDEKKTKDYFTKLAKLIDEHDAIFLLMDSRESRWLPTVMGKAAGKIVMNAALGFDSYVVLRHGAEVREEGDHTLGCYFCNDVVAPGDVSGTLLPFWVPCKY
jgi:ubiquitin-like modifier-activating enzyme ATG7